MAFGFAVVVLSVASATWYRYWLSADRLTWTGSADCVVTFSGDDQNKFAAEWQKQGRVREVWVIRARDTLLVKLGIHECDADTSLRALHKSGVPDAHIRVLSVDAVEGEIPRFLQAIGQASARAKAPQVVVQCHPLETRFLRQIADAALPSQQSDRLRFVPLPHDEYTTTRWWVCRAGWKDVNDISMPVMANVSWGADLRLRSRFLEPR